MKVEMTAVLETPRTLGDGGRTDSSFSWKST